MAKDNPFQSRHNTSFLRRNFQYGCLGILLGVLNIFLFSLGRKTPLSFDDMWIMMMFNIVITLSITNVIFLMEKFFLQSRKLPTWKALLWYYPCIIIGMLVGYELSYLVLHFRFGTEISFATQWNNLRYSILMSIVIGTLIYIYVSRKERYQLHLKEKELELLQIQEQKTQAELQTLQAKINPHFLYNSLNSIASLIHEDANKAEEMVINLSKLFRYAINNQADNFTTLEEELDIVKTYFDIEKIRFGNRLQVEMILPSELSDEKIPRFLIQPLVENAVKHGISKIASNGIIKIAVEKLDGYIKIQISDNGPAFGEGLTAGYGLQSTYDKLKLLYKEDYRLQIIDNPEKSISITLPRLSIVDRS